MAKNIDSGIVDGLTLGSKVRNRRWKEKRPGLTRTAASLDVPQVFGGLNFDSIPRSPPESILNMTRIPLSSMSFFAWCSWWALESFYSLPYFILLLTGSVLFESWSGTAWSLNRPDFDIAIVQTKTKLCEVGLGTHQKRGMAFCSVNGIQVTPCTIKEIMK